MILLCILWMAFWTICDFIVVTTCTPVHQILGIRPLGRPRVLKKSLLRHYPTPEEGRQYYHDRLKAALTHRYKQIERILGKEEADKWWAKNAEKRLHKSKEDIGKELPYPEPYFTKTREDLKTHRDEQARKLLKKYGHEE